MGSFSIWHWLIVLVVVLVLFGGGGKLSKLMGDMGKGVTSFKKGLKDGDAKKDKSDSVEAPSKAIETDEASDSSASDSAQSDSEKDKTTANG